MGDALVRIVLPGGEIVARIDRRRCWPCACAAPWDSIEHRFAQLMLPDAIRSWRRSTRARLGNAPLSYGGKVEIFRPTAGLGTGLFLAQARQCRGSSQCRAGTGVDIGEASSQVFAIRESARIVGGVVTGSCPSRNRAAPIVPRCRRFTPAPSLVELVSSKRQRWQRPPYSSQCQVQADRLGMAD